MKRLVLIDANALVHRAFHALPPLITRKGELTNAVFGFTSVLLKVINELKPDYMAAAFDLAGPTFRHLEYEEYKAKRPKAPDELYEQIPKTKEVLKAFNVLVLEKQGFEADDIIGTVAKKMSKNKIDEIIILTGDLDTLQLVDDKTKVYTLKRGVTDSVVYGEKQVEERYGLKAGQMIDYKGLRGDPSDNIPGVKGVGEKTASILLKEFGTIENLYKKIEKMPKKDIEKHPFLTEKLVEKLKQNKEMAFFSKKLVTICKDVPIKFDLNQLNWQKNYDINKVKQIFDRFNFKTLLKRLPGYNPQPEAEQVDLFS